MHPKDLSIRDYSYELPAHRIARYPLTERDDSKLLVYRNNSVIEDSYRNLANHLPPGALMIFNNTRVVAARLLFQKPTGGMIEIFCLEPHEKYADVSIAMRQKTKVLWHCLVGGASKWKHGQVLEKTVYTQGKEIVLQAAIQERMPDSFVVRLSWTPVSLTFGEVLHLAGAIPLPPYIKREVESEDAIRYQTIYAQSEGSVAAPTAGLHFTPGLFRTLEEKQISRDFITLHVGAGTFKPVKSESMSLHEMHAEFIDVGIGTLENIFETHEALIAVGTTSLRTIESLYWLGVKLEIDPNPSVLELGQWEVYELQEKKISRKAALRNLLTWMNKTGTERLLAHTSLLIAPGYKVVMADALVTNFHQPQSTLLLLVAALVGDDWRRLYDYALQHEFRFLSYGDGSLLWFDKCAAAMD